MKKTKLKLKTKLRKIWFKFRPRPRMKWWQKTIRYSIMASVIGGLALFIVLFIFAVYLFMTLPDISDIEDMNFTQSTLIMDRNGDLLYAIHGEENRKALSDLSEINDTLEMATIAIEDDKFYSHFGIDLPAIARAVLSELGLGYGRGGSTITQQFVKNTFLTNEHSYKRKAQEIMLSFIVELKFTKDEILLLYLNAIPYGSNAYGIETASERYFDKPAAELTLAEASILASIPAATTRYSPYGNYREAALHIDEEALGDRIITEEADLDASSEFTRGLLGTQFDLENGSSFYIKGRSDLVLGRMLDLEMITETEYQDALDEIATIEFIPFEESIEAPHFVLMVKSELENKYGTAVVEQGGLQVYTTLDPDFQNAAEIAVEDRKDFNTTNYGATNGALVSVQPDTGQILAMVGSADYFDDEIAGQVNMITSTRQPGSSFKPFVYALAFLNQYSPATVLYDVSTDFGAGYRPDNYDGSFKGPVSMRVALAQSLNIPAIKAYFLAGQQDEIVTFAQDVFGLTDISSIGDYGPSLALGVAEVTPLDLAGAYSVFANGGSAVELTSILRIENSQGEILEQWEEDSMKKDEVLDPQVAYLINDILSDPSNNLGPSVRIGSIDNAAKTGTSNKVLSNGNILPSDAWLAAYTPNLVTITWAGNADGSAMYGSASGYETAAPIWKDYMVSVLDQIEPTNWNRPIEIQEVAISKASGKLSNNENTPSEMVGTDIFASFAVPTEEDDSYQSILVESITGRLATEWSPENFVEEKTFRVYRSILADYWPSWQTAIDEWIATSEDETLEAAPTELASDIHNEESSANKPEIIITDPISLSGIPADSRTKDIEINVEDVGNGIEKVVFSLNGTVQFRSTEAPYTGTIRLPFLASEGTILTVEAEAIDVYGYSSTSSIQLRISNAETDDDEDSSNEDKTDEEKAKEEDEEVIEEDAPAEDPDENI
jgi:membrane peptidoglycan carboxypeptidase